MLSWSKAEPFDVINDRFLIFKTILIFSVLLVVSVLASTRAQLEKSIINDFYSGHSQLGRAQSLKTLNKLFPHSTLDEMASYLSNLPSIKEFFPPTPQAWQLVQTIFKAFPLVSFQSFPNRDYKQPQHPDQLYS